MRRWELTITLDPARELPLFLQLAAALTDSIRSGRLKPGEALPGSRELAELLGVNRNTVVAGYGELAAEGLVSTRVGGGTFVSLAAMTPCVAHAPPTEAPTYALSAPVHATTHGSVPPAGTLLISNDMPDLRLFPATELARAFRRAIGQRGHSLLTYADPCGHPRLRKVLAAMLASTRGLPVTPDHLMVTHSIEQGIDLVARMLLRPGDVVVVEAFGYPPAWSVLKLAGARLLPLPLDDDGLDLDALEALLAHQPIRAVFVTPHHQFPTTVVMSQARRARLARLALQHGFAIIEDDYDHEFHYASKPILPIASGAGGANVIYIGSLSNMLAPGLGTAFVIAPPPVFERLASLRAASDAHGNVAMECAVAELFEDGELLRHVRRMRRIYASRRDALAASLARHLGSALTFRMPAGGTSLWARVDGAIDVAAWCRAGEREGVQFFAASRYEFFQRERPFLHLGFSYHDEHELDEAARRMARALAQSRGRTVNVPRNAPVRTSRAASAG